MTTRGPLTDDELATPYTLCDDWKAKAINLSDALRAALARAEKAEAVLRGYGVSGVGSRIEELLAERDALRAKLGKAKEALVDIAKVNFAGPPTNDRREWTWATATKTLDDLAKEGG